MRKMMWGVEGVSAIAHNLSLNLQELSDKDTLHVALIRVRQ
jgi:hypothetical protein